MKFLVTGYSGYIGQHLVFKLYKKYPDCEIYGYDEFNMINLFHSYGINVHHVENIDDIKSVFFHAVFHLAAVSNINDFNNNPYGSLASSIGVTKSIIDLMAFVPVKARIIIFASSAAVYKTPEDENHKITVDDPLGPESLYGKSKEICETLLRAGQEELGYILGIARLANVAGEVYPCSENHIPETHIIPQLMKSEMVNIYGADNLESVRDYIHIDDVTEGFIEFYEDLIDCIDLNDVYSSKCDSRVEIRNFSSGRGVKLLDLILLANDLRKPSSPVAITILRKARRGDKKIQVLKPDIITRYSPLDICKSYLK